MKIFGLLCAVALATLAQAAPLIDLSQFEITTDMLDLQLDAIMNAKGGAVPETVKTLVTELDASDKKQIVDYLNDFVKGKIDPPKSTAAFIGILEERVPKLGRRMRKIHDKNWADITALGQPDVLRFAQKWNNKWFEVSDKNLIVWMTNVLSLVPEYVRDIEELEQNPVAWTALCSIQAQKNGCKVWQEHKKSIRDAMKMIPLGFRTPRPN